MNTTEKDGEGERVKLKRLEVGFMENNCYLLTGGPGRDAVVIDPAADPDQILKEAADLSVRYILITHGHGDHIGALEEVRKHTRTPVGIHAEDARSLRHGPDFFLSDGQVLIVGEESLTVLHTPGHSPGGICLLSGNVLFSGDTIFPNGPGNTQIPGSDYQTILRSIHRKIFPLPENTIIYPGHGLETTIGREKKTSFYPPPKEETA